MARPITIEITDKMLSQLVESKRWVGASRRAILFVSGTLAGLLMAWNALEIFWQEHSMRWSAGTSTPARRRT